jgi:PhnB protein
MVSDEFPEMGNVSPDTLGGSTGSLMIYVKDVDAFVAHAVSHGAEIIKPLADQFYGDRNCKLKDPAGHVWFFATHVEDVTPEEMDRRMATFCEGEKQ